MLTKIREELARLPLEEKALEDKRKAASARLDYLRNALRQIEVERKALDLDAKSKREQVAKYKAQMLQTRKNEEYAALDKEIAHVEKAIVAVEDEELVRMERASELDQQIVSEEAQLKVQEADLVKQKEAIAARKTRLDAEAGRVGALQQEAEASVLTCPEGETLLSRYRRLFAAKKKHPVSALVGGICSGCHMKVTAQTVQIARANLEQNIASCESCGRLLYFSE
ncbi:C4-type zinc ribbon domain-containing protein [Verrucomicrobium sp. GAS474]|uniref:zinc ribbon domain-containing protein n=1 Tax=Verrucomicrobium sp. GAS474 TaxID=1882831 RepID=UPI0012FF600A|nr:C4-type zinc ribbon domain-containing protein [Verrucomicrobium sp. GAS474]